MIFGAISEFGKTYASFADDEKGVATSALSHNVIADRIRRLKRETTDSAVRQRFLLWTTLRCTRYTENMDRSVALEVSLNIASRTFLVFEMEQLRVFFQTLESLARYR